MLIQKVSFDWNFIETDKDIQNFLFSSVLSISTFGLAKPNRLFTCKPCRGESDVSPAVLDQEQLACIISFIFFTFLKHNPPRNFS